MPAVPAVVEKQVIDLDFSRGVNERDAPETLDWTKYLRVGDNYDFGYRGYAAVRPGLWAYSGAGTDDQGASMTSILRLLSTGNGVVAIAGTGSDPFRVCHMNEAGGSTNFMTRKNRGSEYSLDVQTIGGMSGVVPSIIGTGLTSKYKILVYAGAGVQDFNVVFADNESGNVVKNYLVNGVSLGVGAMTMVGNILHLYIGTNAGGCKLYQFDSTSLPAASPAGTSATSGGQPIAAVTIGSASFVVMKNGNISKFDTTSTETATGSVAGFATGEIHDANTDGTSIYIVGLNSTPRGLMKVVSSALATTRTVTDTDATLSAARFSVGVDGSSNCALLAFYATVTGSYSTPCARYLTCGSAQSVFTSVQAMPGWGQVSSPWWNSTVGEFYAAMVDLPGAGLGLGHAYQQVVGATVIVNLSGPKTWSSGPVGFHVAAITDRYIDVAGNTLPAAGWCINPQKLFSSDAGLTVTFAMPEKIGPSSFTAEFRTLRLFDVTDIVCSTNTVSGGKTAHYDGLSLSEYGCLSVPTITAVDAGSSIGPDIGVHSYTALFEFVDASGVRHLSRCANPFGFTAANTHATTITLSYPAISDHMAVSYGISPTTNYNFKYHVYRTAAGQTQYFRVASDQVNISSATGATITVTDFVTDTALASNELLHRQPGTPATPLDRYYAPASSSVVRHKDRVFCSRGTDVFYSSFEVFGEAPWFNPAFTFNVPGGTGPITGMASMEGLLVVFKKNAIFVIDGDGPPENGGAGTEFGPPRRIMTELGCIDARTLVSTNEGLIFRSARGLERLTRKMTVDWVGERMWVTVNNNDYSGGAAFDVATGRAIWILSNTAGTYPGQLDPASNGYAVVYDTSSDTWSRYVLRSVAGAGKAFQDIVAAEVGSTQLGLTRAPRFVYGSATKVWFEQSASQSDFITDTFYPVSTEIYTGWVKSQSKQDRISVSDFLLVGTRGTVDNLVNVYYAKDYVDSFTSVKSWSAANINAMGTIAQLDTQPPVEKVQAMAFRIVTSGASGASINGGTLSILGMSVRVGMRGGGVKLAAANKG